MEAKFNIETHPIKVLSTRIGNIEEKIGDAQDIFSRKFNLVQDQVGSLLEKIEEDK